MILNNNLTIMAQFIDQEINGYRVQKAIGEGKFSTVYKALNADNVAIALKKIKIFDMMDPKQREKCLKEVKLMQPLDHANIIKYLDSFIFNNELIIATEWAERGDLKKLIKCAQQDDTPFEEVTLWNYIMQIASALAHMHDKRIMHRDLKPANIFISTDGTLKVGDLGLGRIFSSETIEAYSKVGTPLYMSPELLHGEGYTMKSDVWSLGCIAYEMCEFRSPFKHNEKMSLMDLFNNITKGEYKPVSTRYSQALRDVIDGMIMVDPNKRLDAPTVLQRAQANHQQLLEQKKTPQIYNILVMEDIYEKLTLVQYHECFCLPLKKPPVNKFYFALEYSVNTQQRFIYFVELCYWLMSLPKQKKNKQINPNNLEETAKKLLVDIKQWGIKLPEQLTSSHIQSGGGDMVCFILNDLLNRELIRINFKFDSPQFGKDIESSAIELQKVDSGVCGQLEIEEADDYKEEESVEQDDLTQSIIFYHKKYKSEQIDYNQVPLDRQVLETRVAQTEWMKECQRVEKELTKVEMNLKINKHYLRDHERTMQDLRKSAQVLSQASEYFRSEGVQSVMEEWMNYLDALPKMEQRLTDQIPEATKEQLLENRQSLSNLQCRLDVLQRDVTGKAELDQLLSTQISDLQQRTPVHEDRRNQLRGMLKQLRDEIKLMDIKQGILQTQLSRKQWTTKEEEVSDYEF